MANYPPPPMYGGIPLGQPASVASSGAPSLDDGARFRDLASAQQQAADAYQLNAGLPPVDFQTLSSNGPQLSSFWNQFSSGVFPPPPFYSPHPFANTIHNAQAHIQHPPFGPAAYHSAPQTSQLLPNPLLQRTEAETGLQPQGHPPPLDGPVNTRVAELATSEKEEGELSEVDARSTASVEQQSKRFAPPPSSASKRQRTATHDTSNQAQPNSWGRDSWSTPLERRAIPKSGASGKERVSERHQGQNHRLHTSGSQHTRPQKANDGSHQLRRAPSDAPGVASHLGTRGVPSLHTRPQSPFTSNGRNSASRPTLPTSPPQPTSGATVATQAQPNLRTPQTSTTSPPAAHLESQRARAKEFVQILNKNNYGFAALVNEDLDPTHLKGIYEELKITTDPTAPDASEMGQTQSATNSTRYPSYGAAREKQETRNVPHTDPATKVPDLKAVNLVENTNVPKASAPSAPASHSPKRNAPSAAAVVKPRETSVPRPPLSKPAGTRPAEPAVDRKEYIARLMAAKNRKPTGTGSESPSNAAAPLLPAKVIAQVTQAVEPVVSAPTETHGPALEQRPLKEPDTPANQPALPTTTSETGDQAAQKKRAQTELARKRMEALQSMRKPNGTISIPQTSDGTEPTSAMAIPASHELPKSQNVAASAEPPAASSAIADSQFSPPSVSDEQVVISSAQTSASPGIPGLFMTSTLLEQPTAPVQIQIEPPSTSDSSRKRANAPDSQTADSEMIKTVKRQFGQPRHKQVHESLIIEVSDDESGDSTMDVDEALGLPPPRSILPAPQEPLSTVSPQSLTQHPASLSEVARRPDLVRQPSAGQSPAISTPLACDTPGSYVDIQDKIQALKQEIAEREQRKKERRKGSRAQTPSTPQPAPKPTLKLGKSSEVENESVSALTAQSPPLFTTGQGVVSEPQSSHAEAVGAPAGPSPALQFDGVIKSSPAADREWKQRRRAEIQSGMPTIDATVASNKARMDELKREMLLLEAEQQKHLNAKEQLVQELEGLGVDTEGIPDDELQAKRDEVVQQREDEERPAPQDESQESLQIAIAETPQPEPEPPADGSSPSGQSASTSFYSEPHSPLPAQLGSSINHENSPVAEQEDAMDVSDSEAEGTNGGVSVSDSSNQPRQPTEGAVEEIAVPHQTPEATSQNSREESISEDFYEHNMTSGASEPGEVNEHVDMLEAPDHRAVAVEEAAAENVDMDVDARSSSSQSEDYEPPGPSDAIDELVPDATADHDLEPPDANSRASRSPRPPSQEVSHEDHTIPLSADANATPTAEAETAFQRPLEPHTIPAARNPPPHVDDQGLFRPYQSPLRMFKSYRYHPQYTDGVPGGFRSMTYSHQIDPNTPVCPYEAAGGTCNDDKCENQHFRTMSLSDDMILVQLGTTNPGRTPDEKQRWTEGLKQVLRDLRQKNTKDPDTVASEIAKYRRTFLNDETMVLNL